VDQRVRSDVSKALGVYVMKTFGILALILGFTGSLFEVPGYVIDRQNAILVGKITPGVQDIAESLYSVGARSSQSIKSEGAVLAVRVCSDRALPLALMAAFGSPLNAIELLEKNHAIRSSHIYYLRKANNCKPNEANSTEYWLVPKDAEFPEFTEWRRADHLISRTVVDDGYSFEGAISEKLSPDTYGIILERIAKSLKDDRTGFVLIRYSQNGAKRRSAAADRALEAENYLINQGISSYRIIVERRPSYTNKKSANLAYPTIIVSQFSNSF
jgi:hypothetical protein